jgi:hypothetical protein
MKPEAGDILNISADQLMGTILPQLSVSYLQGTTAIHAILMKLAAREYERGAEIRVAENADMRAAFAELAPIVRDDALKAKLDAAPADTALAISALDAVNTELRRLLIALHIHVEDIGARDAEGRLLKLLKDMAARRAVSLF